MNQPPPTETQAGGYHLAVLHVDATAASNSETGFCAGGLRRTMHNTNTKTPSSFVGLTVGIFIGAMFVLPMFAYVCRVNGQLRQENQRLRVQVVKQASPKPLVQRLGICLTAGTIGHTYYIPLK